MAVAIDVTGTNTLSTSSASPHTYTGLTTGGSLSNGAVCFIVCYDVHVTGSAATWDGVACTLVASQNNTATNGRIELWALSPIGTHTGAKTFSVSWTGGGAAQTSISGLSWTGVDQTGGTTSFPNGTGATSTATNPVSVTVTSATGDAVVAGFTTDGSFFTATNNTNIFLLGNSGNLIDAAGNRAAGAATVAMTGTLSAAAGANAAAGVDIKQASAGGSPVIPYDLSNGPWRVHQTQIDLSRSLNLNLYKNPIPFGPYDYGDGPYNVRRFAPDASKSLNLNLFKNPIPFGPYDYGDGPWRVKSTPLAIQPYNPSLYSVTVTFDMMGQIWM